eukprot:TRINITY_DN7989_c0_g1_i1.p1 TRINITY_DN7989_c0_g1~~TRINITY_DN7989_c0_g1_i1.p1  ORF type:complete len:364 (+),score=27.65 TRINITY_DN7989_c0_g1_i1:356-1447(+)
MALIPLKSQYVSLIVTIILSVSEVALLAACLQWNCFLENKKLQRREKVNVRDHRIRTKFLSVAVISIFVILEIFNSFYSDPTTIDRLERRPCTFLGSGGRKEGFTNLTSLSSIILLDCMDANRTMVRQRAGFLSRDPIVTQCNEVLYSFSTATDEAMEAVPQEIQHFTGCVPVPEIGDEAEICALLYQRGEKVTFTEHMYLDEVEYVIEEKVLLRVWHTHVHFNVTGLESELARRAVTMLLTPTSSDTTIRREVFTSDGVGMCDFRKHINATVVSNGFIYAMAIVSIASLLILAVSALFRRQIRYDMSNPLHWAQNTVIPEHLLGAENPEIYCSDADGRQFAVSCNLSELNSLRQRVSNLLRG